MDHWTNLEKVEIMGCAELASLDGCGSTLPSRLKQLYIEDCPKLASLAPILHHSINLERVEIRGCAELALSLEEGDGCGSTLPSRLKELHISNCPKLASLVPMLRHHWTNLERVTIWSCAELASLDGCGSTLPSRLKKLDIFNCPKLASLAPILHHSTNLERLEIRGCGDQQLGLWWEEEGDDERGCMLPSGLKNLTIDGCSWELLPPLSHLTALQELSIWGFRNLRCIPPSVTSLRSLEVLEIVDCPAIESLPDGGLPPSLRRLSIWWCPLLEGRCREGGPERPKIPTTTEVDFR